MSIHQQVAAMVAADQAKYRHWSLGDLIEALKGVDAKKRVTVDDQYSPGVLDSYRGFYDQLAIEPSELLDPVRVGEFLKRCKVANGGVYHGYKGGEYHMTLNTSVWLSAYGECWSRAVVGLDEHDDRVVIRTRRSPRSKTRKS